MTAYSIIDLRPTESIADRIFLLEVKQGRLKAPTGRRMSHYEREYLAGVLREVGIGRTQLSEYRTTFVRLHQELWQLENEMRKLERRGEYGSRFVRIGHRIVYLNGMRRAAREAFHNRCLGNLAAEAEFSEVSSGIDSYLDRLAIQYVRYGPDHPLISHGSALLQSAVGCQPFGVQEFRRLLMIHRQMTNNRVVLEDAPGEEELSLDLVPFYRSVYILNDQRVQELASIRAKYPASWWDYKEYEVYEMPSDWDPARFCLKTSADRPVSCEGVERRW